MRTSAWLPHVAIAMILVILFLYRSSVPTGQLDLTVQWLLVAVVVISAWICSRWMATTGCLVALLFWSWIEIQTPRWTEWLPGQLVRLVVALGLLAWLLRLREQLAIAQRLARVDGLTGLPNRQALIEALEAELSRAKRFGRPFSLAVLDCDGFKQINDLRGHMAGDEVLRRIGESLRQNTRPFDCAGRWGGDEFLIVMSEVDCDDAQLVAERLRATMRHHVERDHPSLTFSLGIVTVRNAGLNWEECVSLADEAMYAAKRLGPDQTRFEVV